MDMGFEAAGFIRFVFENGWTGECYFDIVDKTIEHLMGIAVGIFHLLGGLAIDGNGNVFVVFGADADIKPPCFGVKEQNGTMPTEVLRCKAKIVDSVASTWLDWH